MSGPMEDGVDVLLQTARQLRVRLLQQGGNLGKLIPEYGRTYGQTLKRVRDFEVCTQTSDAAFQFDSASGVMRLNAAHVAAIEARIETFRLGGSLAGMLNSEDVAQLRREAVEIFVLHELRHFSQGIANFEDVQAVKATEGSLFLAKLDLIADNNAARVWAWLNACEEGDTTPRGFLFHYLDALTFICATCVTAFGAPLSKPAKVSRALGLYLMLARLVLARDHFEPAEPSLGFLLDTPIMPTFARDFTSMTLVAFEPEMVVKVASFPCDTALLKRFTDHLAAGEFYEAFGMAKYLAASLFSHIEQLVPVD